MTARPTSFDECAHPARPVWWTLASPYPAPAGLAVRHPPTVTRTLVQVRSAMPAGNIAPPPGVLFSVQARRAPCGTSGAGRARRAGKDRRTP
jgi:hypothetical protein